MAMHAISLLPLTDDLYDCDVRQTWFADDATAGGSLIGLSNWWSRLVSLGPAYGYFVNADKTWLIVKAESLSTAERIFAGCGVNITVEGKRHLGAAIGSRSFVKQYIVEKVNYWVSCVRRLSQIARVQPHVAYSAFTHGLIGKWTYFLCTVPEISDLLKPLEAIAGEFIPAVTGRSVGELERKLFALPVRMGGLGLTDPSAVAGFEFNASVSVTSALITQIVQQQNNFNVTVQHSRHLFVSKSKTISV